MKMKKTNTQAQIGLIGLIMMVPILIVFGAVLPVIVTTIDNATPYLNGSAGVLLRLTPLFMVVAIIAIPVIYSQVVRAQ